MGRLIMLFVALLVILPRTAYAGSGPSVTPETVWQSWNVDALVILNLCLLGWLYALGLRRLRKRPTRNRSLRGWQATAFYSSLVLIAVVLLSPLDGLSEQLGSAHMVQHMLLMVVAAPLFIYGLPRLVLPLGLIPPWRAKVANVVRSCAADFFTWPWFASLLYAVVLWSWHLPVAYQAALFDPLLHDAQHLSFFLAACLFWKILLDPSNHTAAHPLTAMGVLFFTALHSMVLGVFMSLSPQVWYDVYTARTGAWGLTPLADQQLAGLLMWLPACLVYPAAAALLFGNWLARLHVQQCEPSLLAPPKGA
jgi:putative membrane protein